MSRLRCGSLPLAGANMLAASKRVVASGIVSNNYLLGQRTNERRFVKQRVRGERQTKCAELLRANICHSRCYTHTIVYAKVSCVRSLARWFGCVHFMFVGCCVLCCAVAAGQNGKYNYLQARLCCEPLKLGNAMQHQHHC